MKTILISLATCILTIALMRSIFFFVLPNFGDWTMDVFAKYLIVDVPLVDQYILMFFPIIIGIFLVLIKKTETTKVLKSLAFSIAFVYLLLGFGFFMALYTWTAGDNPLLPLYIKYQPFPFYWTIFILTGIVISIWFISRSAKGKENEVLDQ